MKYIIIFYCNHYYAETFFVHSTKASVHVKTELSKPSSTNIQLHNQWVSVVLKIMIINMFHLGDKKKNSQFFFFKMCNIKDNIEGWEEVVGSRGG